MSKHHIIPFPGYFVLATPLRDYRSLDYTGTPLRSFAGVIKTGRKNTRGGVYRMFHVRNFGIMIHRSK